MNRPKSISLLDLMLQDGIIPTDEEVSEIVDDVEISDTDVEDTDTVVTEDDAEEIIEEAKEEVSGNESFSFISNSQLHHHAETDRKKPSSFFIFKESTEDVKIWILTDGIIDTNSVNNFSYLFDSILPGTKVTIYFGSDLAAGNNLNGIGALVSSIIRCKGEVVGIVNGLCGLFETILFVFCHKRIMRKFGQITIESGYLAKQYPTVFKPIIDTIFDRIDEIGLLDIDDLEVLIKDDSSVTITPEMFEERHESKIK